MTGKPEREVDERLADWVDGRLSERDRERFAAELRVSPQLRKDLEEYEKTVAAVRAALQAPSRPVQIADRVMAAIAAGNTRPGVGPRWRSRSFLWSLASAAALLVLALLVNTWSPAPHTDTTASLDEAKPEGAKQRAADDLRKLGDEAGAVPAHERLDREKSEQVAVEELERQLGANPVAPAKKPAPAAPAPTAAAREPVPAEGNDPAPAAAVGQDKPAAPAARAQPATDPASPTGDAGNNKQPGGGGAKPVEGAPVQNDRFAMGAWSETLPVLVVQGGAFAADPSSTESRPEADRRSDPRSSQAEEVGKPPQDRQPAATTPVTGATGAGTASRKDKDADAADLPLRLEAFFKRQMTVATPAETASETWSAGGLQFTPLPDPTAFASSLQRKEPEAKLLGESTKERSRAAAGGRDGAPRLERGWLVEGSKEDIALVVQQLSQFARASGMQLSSGEADETALPKRIAPEGPARASREGDKADTRRTELARSRLVLRFSAQPR